MYYKIFSVDLEVLSTDSSSRNFVDLLLSKDEVAVMIKNYYRYKSNSLKNFFLDLPSRFLPKKPC